MTQEQKDLLLKDLCARLPYGVKCSHKNEGIFSLTCIDLEYNYIYVKHGGFKIGEPEINHRHIKPYLFPMSSMTEEQKKELNDITDLDIEIAISNIKNDTPNYVTCLNRLNWLLKNHFDIYNLIPMGLANDATGLNIY